MKQTITVQRKGRIKGGLIGGLLLGPIGLIGGSLLGTRTQVTISDEEAAPKPEPSMWACYVCLGLVALTVLMFFI